MASEKRLIDANAFLDEALKRYTERERGRDLLYTACEVKQNLADMICEAPTVDAVEVVHGRWIDESCGYWRCSSCRILYTFDDYGDVHPVADCGFSYCPNCGAKMDLDENDFCTCGERKEDES